MLFSGSASFASIAWLEVGFESLKVEVLEATSASVRGEWFGFADLPMISERVFAVK
jgi:hypothetical protein